MLVVGLLRCPRVAGGQVALNRPAQHPIAGQPDRRSILQRSESLGQENNPAAKMSDLVPNIG